MLLALVAALFIRSWLRIYLGSRAIADDIASDLSYLVVPPVLAALCWPVLMQQGSLLQRSFAYSRLSAKLVVTALVIAALLRISWWMQTAARISFGLAVDGAARVTDVPVVHFACPAPIALLLAVLVMAVLVPVVEESLHRGVLQSAFAHRGKLQAITLSSLLFAVFHAPASFAFVLIPGVIFGLMFWGSATLWFPIIAHAAYNGIALLDWRCMQLAWNPATSQAPQFVSGVVFSLGFGICAAATLALVHERWIGAPTGPRS